MKIMALKAYTKEWLEELCKESSSYAEVLRKAGRKQGGGTQETLRKKIAEWEIDISHFTGQLWNKNKTKLTDERIAQQAKNQEKYNPEEIFVKNSSITQKVLRGYIERYQAIPYECSCCNCNGQWQGGEISLELHHIDGDNTNNEISNLTYLCPNCHALTKNYRGKNKQITQPKDYISEEDFVMALQNTPNIRQALLSLGLAAKGANYTRAKSIMEKYSIQK